MKKCITCKKEKDDVCFTNNTKSCDSCKERKRIKNAIYREKNKERVKEYAKKWYVENREKVRADNQKWYTENREKVIAKSQKWQAENREKNRESSRKWYTENPEKARAIQKRKVQRLDDHYIAVALKVPVEELRKSPDLLEAKRIQIQIHRLVKTKTSNHGKSNEH